MNIELNYEQRALLELISLHTGKSTAQVLIEAAQSLHNRDIGYTEPPNPSHSQRFLADSELEARFARLLHR